MKTMATMSRTLAAVPLSLFVLGVASAPAAADTTWFAKRAVNVRTSPSLSGDVRFTIGVNTRVTRDQIQGDWWHLRAPVAGWASADAFSSKVNWSAGGFGGRYVAKMVRVRTGPSVGEDSRGTLTLNSVVVYDATVWKGDGDHWVHTRYPLMGWVAADALSRHPFWAPSHVGGRYAKSTLNVRTGPGVNYQTVSRVGKDAKVEVDAYLTSGWAHIKYPHVGWVYGRNLTTSAPYQLVWPVSGRVSTTWYYRHQSINGGFHGAVDIAGNNGRPAGAARNGRVVVAAYGYNGGYGNHVRIGHENGWTTDYHHFRSLAVRAGQSVGRLQTVGYVGDTGLTTGPHLHFDLRHYGTKVFMSAVTGQYLTKGTAVPNRYSGL